MLMRVKEIKLIHIPSCVGWEMRVRLNGERNERELLLAQRSGVFVFKKLFSTVSQANEAIGDPPNRQYLNIQSKYQLQNPDKAIIKKLNTQITFHMRQGHCEAALELFLSMPQKSVVSWNAMLSGYLSNARFSDARHLFDKMPKRDLVSWNLMLNGYIMSQNLTAARGFFEKMPERDVVSWNTMLSGYARAGFVDEAKKVFSEMPHKNSISWNGLLATYVQNGRIDEAAELFKSRDGWPLVSWNCLMGGYAKMNRLAEAREVFNRMPKRDQVSWNIMISSHAQNEQMSEALSLFVKCPSRDVITWTAMVSGYIQNGMLDEARRVFDQMPEKNIVSWNSMLSGYVHYKRIDLARELFDAMPSRSISSWNSMISGYAQRGDIAEARGLFNEMPQRDVISWSAMIAGYVQSGHSEEALNLFVEMQRNKERANKSVFTCILSTCADIGVLALGMQLHGQVIKVGFESATFVGNALVAMYCKCGSIDEANCAFKNIIEKDTVSWNTMIAGYARHGFGQQALVIFESMTEAGARVDDATMVTVLSACAHAGLVDRAKQHFYGMYSDYGIVPSPRHYTCMIDLLGRAGSLDDAQNLVRNMPFAPDAATWGALLGAARVHGNLELAEKAAKIIFEMEPNNSGMYVLLSNIYASSGRWYDVQQMRLKMRDRGVKKLPGYSWLEVQNKIHTFSAGDTCHPEKDRIYAFLEELESRLKQVGYVSSIKLVLHDVDEEEKEHLLKYHSERLAIAYGILTSPPKKPVCIMKNLRICEDCHNVVKLISTLEERLIIIRDSNRFHHFQNGSCSCRDYW